MKENQTANKSLWLGLIGLLVPPISLAIISSINSFSEFVINILLILTVICFAAPLIIGFYLTYKFFTDKSALTLILAILNIISLVWLFFLLAMLVFQNVKDF